MCVSSFIHANNNNLCDVVDFSKYILELTNNIC